MSSTIIDAGPCINFLASNCERILFRVAGKGIAVPATVKSEVLRKSGTDDRFARVHANWARLEANEWLSVLSDDASPLLQRAAQDVMSAPLAERMRTPKNLGEEMVVAHSVALAYSGIDVIMIIDDGAGRTLASNQIARLEVMATSGTQVGSLALYGTVDILRTAAGSDDLADKDAMRRVYERIRELDDGLPTLAATGLMGPHTWSTR